MKRPLRAKLIAALATALVVLPGLLVPQTAAAVDIYITPGNHNVNGREWRTTCQKYSSTVTRCRTEIKATEVKLVNGRYVTTNGWAFNNLTYKASPRAQWVDNNLGKNAQFTSEGREWYTQCDSPQTGYNGCRSYIWATYVTAKKTAGGTVYEPTQGWLFNNMVRFTTNYYATYSGTGDDVLTLPKGATELFIRGTHQGSGNFIVWGLDRGNSETDLAINEIGQVNVAGAIGILDDDTVKLQVQADGPWRLTVQPLSTAPKLETSGATGIGSSVLWYYGPPKTFSASHTGSSNFILWQWADEDSKLLVNEIGNYTGRIAFLGGPSIIEIDADGEWRIS